MNEIETLDVLRSGKISPVGDPYPPHEVAPPGTFFWQAEPPDSGVLRLCFAQIAVQGRDGMYRCNTAAL